MCEDYVCVYERTSVSSRAGHAAHVLLHLALVACNVPANGDVRRSLVFLEATSAAAAPIGAVR